MLGQALFTLYSIFVLITTANTGLIFVEPQDFELATSSQDLSSSLVLSESHYAVELQRKSIVSTFMTVVEARYNFTLCCSLSA